MSPPFLSEQPLKGTPNAVLIARYCKLFGISPADELGLLDRTMRMAVNWACYIAYQKAENDAYEESKKEKKEESTLLGEHLDSQLKELEEISKSRGS